MHLPDGDGLELVREIQKDYPHIPVAVITAFGNMDKAVESLKAGAFDYVAKPLDIKILRKMVQQASILNSAMTNHGSPKIDGDSIETKKLDAVLIGQSPPMKELKQQVLKVAKSQAPIFIYGESGTGKEVVARSIHNLSSRQGGPFIAVNCGAIPGELIESELFGHKKGSFSGAIQDKIGLFEAAEGGTLFLDEVADIPIPMQVKLLRVIQEKKLRPVGETQEKSIDCRILSATHKNLEILIQNNIFRDDLYYRINVIQLSLPALRDRGEDVLLLAEKIMKDICEELDLSTLTLSPSSQALLLKHRFHGNIRELQNALQRACALCDSSIIEPEHLQLEGSNTKAPEESLAQVQPSVLEKAAAPSTSEIYDPQSTGPLEDYLQEIETNAIKSALEATHWNRTAAAKLLGMSFRSLRYRLNKLGLEE
jgi:two-component system response regulator PilR (NtrC family)